MAKADSRYGIIDGVDTWEGTITCSHCLEIDEEQTDYPRGLNHDGDKATFACSECGKDSKVTLCVSYTFQTEKIEK